MRYKILAVGALKDKQLNTLVQDYTKRLTWQLDIQYVKDSKAQKAAIIPNIPLYALDERGQNLSSNDFTKLITKNAQAQFIIGGADGLDDDLRKSATALIAFGHMTWPHRLALLMLVEQIYRAQQIYTGHPYHRA